MKFHYHAKLLVWGCSLLVSKQKLLSKIESNVGWIIWPHGYASTEIDYENDRDVRKHDIHWRNEKKLKIISIDDKSEYYKW